MKQLPEPKTPHKIPLVQDWERLELRKEFVRYEVDLQNLPPITAEQQGMLDRLRLAGMVATDEDADCGRSG